MREIKFRAWDTVIKKYDDRRLVIDNGIVYGAFRHPIIIEQYTGLKDKNGIEIYEGDVIYTNDIFIGKKRQMVWHNETASFMTKGLEHIKDATGKDIFGNFRHIKYMSCKCEIIGNIHEDVL